MTKPTPGELDDLMRQMGIDPDLVGKPKNLTKSQELGWEAMRKSKEMLKKYKKVTV